MLKLKRRGTCTTFKVRSHQDHPIMQCTPVSVENPVTGNLEEHLVPVFIVPSPIDETLRASDFALEVQLRNGVQLKECQQYLKPKTIEEYSSMLTSVINSIQCESDKQLQLINVRRQTTVNTSVAENVVDPKTEKL